MSARTAQEFPDFLKSRLPRGNQVRVFHVSTSPSPCASLFAPAAGLSEEATTLESHFLALSQLRLDTDQSVDRSLNLLALGIEVLIFTTSKLTTIFVSKADSTGFLSRPTGLQSRRTSLVQIVITAFLDFLLKSHRHRGRLVLSLFARSQNQYLFPGSIENITKHVLDDRQLIKWWCRILDPVARQARADALHTVRAHVVVPGCDGGETKAFFPTSARADATSDPLWLNAYPVTLMVEDSSLPPRCLVPRLPDDPKSRFLEDLDGQRDSDGTWRGIKTLDQFWEMMSYRQECSAGRVVGFVWVVFLPTAESVVGTGGAVNDDIFTKPPQNEMQQSVSVSDSVTSSDFKIPQKDRLSAGTSAASSPIGPDIVVPGTFRHNLVTGTMGKMDNDPSAKGNLSGTGSSEPAAMSGNLESQAEGLRMMTSVTCRPPGDILLSAEDYQILMDELLQLDFEGKACAIESSMRWQEKAMNLAHVSRFGIDVEGTLIEDLTSTASTSASASASAADTTSTPTINTLTAVRKKRKAEMAINGQVAEIQPVNTLAMNLVRKKPKA